MEEVQKHTSSIILKELILMYIVYLVGIFAFILDTIFSKRIKKIDDQLEESENKDFLLQKRKAFLICRGCCIVMMIGACVFVAFTLL